MSPSTPCDSARQPPRGPLGINIAWPSIPLGLSDGVHHGVTNGLTAVKADVTLSKGVLSLKKFEKYFLNTNSTLTKQSHAGPAPGATGGLRWSTAHSPMMGLPRVLDYAY